MRERAKTSERWKEVRAEEGGSRFRERTEKVRETERRKEIEVSTAGSVFLLYKSRLCSLFNHEQERSTSNCGKITDARKKSHFQEREALSIVRHHHM